TVGREQLIANQVDRVDLVDRIAHDLLCPTLRFAALTLLQSIDHLIGIPADEAITRTESYGSAAECGDTDDRVKGGSAVAHKELERSPRYALIGARPGVSEVPPDVLGAQPGQFAYPVGHNELDVWIDKFGKLLTLRECR